MTAEPIVLRFASFNEIEINKREALRYMGYKMKSVPNDIEGLFSDCIKLLSDTVTYKACLTKTKVKIMSDGRLDLGFGEFISRDLEKNLSGCPEAYIFAATAGTGVDRLIMRYSKIQPSKSLVIDALASAAVEGWCDKINGEMKQTGKTKPRFSPGYGDLNLSVQKNILDFLDAYRKIGLSLSDSLLMTPIKSVTAIVGLMPAELSDKKHN